MTSRREFLKKCAVMASCATVTPTLSMDQSYKLAVDKIWLPQIQNSKNSNRPNILLTNISPLSKEWARMATLAASSHNTQPWKFKLEKDSITIFPDYTRRCPAVDPDDSHLFKSLGCAAENVIQAAVNDGFVANARFDERIDAVVIDFDQTAIIQSDSLSAAIPNRRCSRTLYDGNPLELSLQNTLMNAATSNEITPLFLQSHQEMEAMIEYVRHGDIAQFNDPSFVKELGEWIRFNPTEAIAKRDGLAGEISGQPELPSWLGRRIFNLFLTGKKQADSDAKTIRSSSGIIVLVGLEDNKSSWVAAGRSYQRFALQATALNIRNAFINQPIEVRHLRPQLHAWLGVPKHHVHLIARFGRGPNAPHSLRRPIETVIIS